MMGADFRKNLRGELDYRDMTVKELSAKTGIAKGTLDSYLGVRASIPPADIAVRIAQALNVSVEYLVTGVERKPGMGFYLPNENVRSLVDIVSGLDERSSKIMLGLARVLKKQVGGGGGE
jgi:transcriptional regulator with XRE-family HTH domain